MAKSPGDGKQKDTDKEKQGGKGKLIAIVAVAVVVLVGGGGTAAYFTGLLDGILPRKGAKSAVIELGPPVTHQLPQIKADLKTDKCKSALLRTTIVVQLATTDLPRLQASELRIIDSVRTYLRDQERQDLVGKQGTDKLRGDLTNIINGVIMPAAVHSILFKELVLQ
jgi:flagellar FliL protein